MPVGRAGNLDRAAVRENRLARGLRADIGPQPVACGDAHEYQPPDRCLLRDPPQPAAVLKHEIPSQNRDQQPQINRTPDGVLIHAPLRSPSGR